MVFKYLKDKDGNNRTDAFRMTMNGVDYQIPNDPKNKDYQLYLKWLEDGNTTEDSGE